MKSAGEFIDEQTKFGAVAQTREMLANLMIKYASQAIDKCAESVLIDCDDARRLEQSKKFYGYADDVYTVDYESILKVKDQLK